MLFNTISQLQTDLNEINGIPFILYEILRDFNRISYFECAYMAEETKPLATIPFPSFDGIDFPRDYPIEIVDDGDIIHIKGRDFICFVITE